MKHYRILSVILALTLVLSTTTTGFCTTAEISPYGSSNDRFRYEYETTPLSLVSVTEITDKQATNQAVTRTIALAVIGSINWIGTATALATSLGNDIYGMNQAGTIYAYTSVKTKYKINVTTGNRTVAAKWKIATFKLYNSSGGLEKTRTHTIKVK